MAVIITRTFYLHKKGGTFFFLQPHFVPLITDEPPYYRFLNIREAKEWIWSYHSGDVFNGVIHDLNETKDRIQMFMTFLNKETHDFNRGKNCSPPELYLNFILHVKKKGVYT